MKYTLVSLGIFTVLLSTIVYLFNSRASLREELNMQVGNVKAYASDNSLLKEHNRVFKLSIEQMEYFNDSIFNKLLAVQKELKIKDREVSQLQYRLTTISKSDTVVLRDTIFIDPKFELDTILGDKWFTQRLYLKYPNKIVSTPRIVLENSIVVHNSKETIKPPKKFFLWRWFQRKHTVLLVEVHEENKYATDSISRFIQVIK